jgi:hypothetical protein
MDELVPAALYPTHVRQIPGLINGTAFFPGGSGLYLKERDRNIVEFPFCGVMVLGHNFDSEAGYRKSFERGEEILTTGTWGPILALLYEASIPVGQCFFTNAFMGLCEGDNNKHYRGRDDPNFRTACLNFLKAQIGIQRPRFILTLGLHVPPLLACASADLTAWKGKRKGGGCDPELHLKEIDEAPLFPNVGFELDDGSFHTAVVTAIAHPSDRRNGARRAPKGFPPGGAGEAELIRTGWKQSSTLGP